MTGDAFIAAGAWGIFVFLRAFQQRNVAFLNYILVVPTSWMMAVVEIVGLTKIVDVGFSWSFVLLLGTSTGLSAMAAMFVHHRYVHGRKRLQS